METAHRKMFIPSLHPSLGVFDTCTLIHSIFQNSLPCCSSNKTPGQLPEYFPGNETSFNFICGVKNVYYISNSSLMTYYPYHQPHNQRQSRELIAQIFFTNIQNIYLVLICKYQIHLNQSCLPVLLFQSNEGILHQIIRFTLLRVTDPRIACFP